MEKSGKQQWILGLALVFMLSLAPTRSEEKFGIREAFFNCSRYEFIHNLKKTWGESKKACAIKKGNLVTMETEEEWKFVNGQIQNIDVGKNSDDNEWYIGLTKEDTKWKWINGQDFNLVGKWYSTERNKQYVKMIKIYNKKEGLFDDVPGARDKPYICEYLKDSKKCPKHVQTTSTLRTTAVSSLGPSPVTQSTTTKVVKATTTKTTTTKKKAATTTTTTKPSTAKSKRTHQTESTEKQTSESSIITSIPTSHTAFLNTKTEVKETPKSPISTTVGKPKDHQKSDNKQDDGMMIIYIAVSLAVVLVILICVLGVFYWKRLKKEKRKTSEDKLIDSSMATSSQPTTTANVNEIMKSSSFVAFKMVHNNLSDATASSGRPVYDNVCTDNNQGVDKGSQLTDTNEGSQGNQNVSVKKKKFSLKRNKGSVSESNRISKADEVKMNDVSASTSTDENKSSDEVVYAAVDKTKKKMVIQEVTYADLAPFNNNAEVNVHKPEPYQPVEYAVIIGKKASKSSK